MHHIGIDVHKLRCVVGIKGESSPDVLRRTSFANDIDRSARGAYQTRI